MWNAGGLQRRRPGIHVGALETCDGYDNDCDGMIDNDPVCVTSCPHSYQATDPAFLTASAAYLSPSLVWTGSEYGVAWHDDRTGSDRIYFARLDSAGNKIGNDTELSLGTAPSLVWTGTEYAVAYRNQSPATLFFQRIDASGSPVGPASQVAQPGVSPSLAWTGSEYGLAFSDSNGIQFKRLDAAGQEIAGSQVTVYPGGAPSESWKWPELVWNGNGYGVGFMVRKWTIDIWYFDHVMFQALDAAGNLIGGSVDLSGDEDEGVAIHPTVAWSGSEFGVAWHTGFSIRFARVDGSGNQIGSTLTVAGPAPVQISWVDIAWTGGEYGLVWSGYTHPSNSQIYLTRLDCSGGQIGDQLQVPGVHDGEPTKLAWSGTQYGMVWKGALNESEDWTDYFTRFACGPCIDHDGDDSTNCDDCDLLTDEDGPGEDSDLDGLHNLCDNCPAVSNPSQVDTDADAVGNACDNCALAINPGQEDMDVDGRGDAYSISRGDLSTLGPNSYGDCLAEGVMDLTHQDSAIPALGQGCFYLVQGQSFECGLGPLGWCSDGQPRLNPGGGACDGHPHTDVHASDEANVYGTVTGSYTDTLASDDTHEAIEEELSGGNPASRHSRLEHRWTLDLTPGSRIEFHVEGYRTLSADGDHFLFDYSTDGGTIWQPIPLGSLATLSDDGIDLVAELPADLSGSVLFRVVDSDRTGLHQDLDTVFIDELFVRVIP